MNATVIGWIVQRRRVGDHVRILVDSWRNGRVIVEAHNGLTDTVMSRKYRAGQEAVVSGWYCGYKMVSGTPRAVVEAWSIKPWHEEPAAKRAKGVRA